MSQLTRELLRELDTATAVSDYYRSDKRQQDLTRASVSRREIKAAQTRINERVER